MISTVPVPIQTTIRAEFGVTKLLQLVCRFKSNSKVQVEAEITTSSDIKSVYSCFSSTGRQNEKLEREVHSRPVAV